MQKSVYERFGHTLISGTQEVERKHTVIGGDTLPKIAAFEYDAGYDSELWRQLAEANSIDDLDAVTVGSVLKIVSPTASSD